MSLFEQISIDIKSAMLAREKEKLEALRAVKAALLLTKSEKGDDNIPPEKELALLNKLVKQRKEAAEIYLANGREELGKKELFEAEVIEQYLPAKLSEDELINALQNIIRQTGAVSHTDFGKVMGIASKTLSGKADGKTISEQLKKMLNS
jgi:uncharacterized protein